RSGDDGLACDAAGVRIDGVPDRPVAWVEPEAFEHGRHGPGHLLLSSLNLTLHGGMKSSCASHRVRMCDLLLVEHGQQGIETISLLHVELHRSRTRAAVLCCDITDRLIFRFEFHPLVFTPFNVYV